MCKYNQHNVNVSLNVRRCLHERVQNAVSAAEWSSVTLSSSGTRAATHPSRTILLKAIQNIIGSAQVCVCVNLRMTRDD